MTDIMTEFSFGEDDLLASKYVLHHKFIITLTYCWIWVWLVRSPTLKAFMENKYGACVLFHDKTILPNHRNGYFVGCLHCVK